MSTTVLFIIYSSLIAAASMLGGLLPSLIKLTHTRTQLIMSFVAGLMLGVACYHLIPHSVVSIGGDEAVEKTVWWLMIGLLVMFVLLRTFHFHQHDHSDEHDHHHHHGHEHSHGASSLSWVGVATGLTLHTLIDGVALGAAILADTVKETAGLFSLGVFVAIVLHKPLDAMSITSLMRISHFSQRKIMLVNAVFATMCPLGALLFFWGIDLVSAQQTLLVGAALAFSAGVFLCISLSDLLPEVQFHSHDSVKLTIALALGVALAYGIGMLEPEHSHRYMPEHSHRYTPEHAIGVDPR